LTYQKTKPNQATGETETLFYREGKTYKVDTESGSEDADVELDDISWEKEPEELVEKKLLREVPRTSYGGDMYGSSSSEPLTNNLMMLVTSDMKKELKSKGTEYGS